MDDERLGQKRRHLRQKSRRVNRTAETLCKPMKAAGTERKFLLLPCSKYRPKYRHTGELCFMRFSIEQTFDHEVPPQLPRKSVRETFRQIMRPYRRLADLLSDSFASICPTR